MRNVATIRRWFGAAQVRDLDDLSSKTVYYLTRSINDERQTTAYRNIDHYSVGEYRIEVFERR